MRAASRLAASALILAAACLHAAQPAAPAFDGGRAYEHLRQIVAIGPRERIYEETYRLLKRERR